MAERFDVAVSSMIGTERSIAKTVDQHPTWDAPSPKPGRLAIQWALHYDGQLGVVVIWSPERQSGDSA
jgi:hypothetical protein